MKKKEIARRVEYLIDSIEDIDSSIAEHADGLISVFDSLDRQKATISSICDRVDYIESSLLELAEALSLDNERPDEHINDRMMREMNAALGMKKQESIGRKQYEIEMKATHEARKQELLKREKTREQWEAVIKGNYICGFSNKSQEEAEANASRLIVDFGRLVEVASDGKFTARPNRIYVYCAIRRVEGERQPWFDEGKPNLPDDAQILIRTDDGNVFTGHTCDFGWDSETDEANIVEFTWMK